MTNYILILIVILFTIFVVQLNQQSRNLKKFKESVSLYHKESGFVYFMKMMEDRMPYKVEIEVFDSKTYIFKKESEFLTTRFVITNKDTLTYSIYTSNKNICLKSGEGVIYETIYKYISHINELTNK